MSRTLRSNGTSTNQGPVGGNSDDSMANKPVENEAAAKEPVSNEELAPAPKKKPVSNEELAPALKKKPASKQKPAPKTKPAVKKLPAKEAAAKKAAAKPTAKKGVVKKGVVKKGAVKKGAAKKGTLKPDLKVTEAADVTQKLQVIAHLENSAATAYADNTTPGGPPPNTKKGSRKVATPKQDKGKKAGNTTDVSDAETIGELTETDVEGTVKGKRSRREERSYRDTLIGMRTTLSLTPINEDEEGREQAKETHQLSLQDVVDNAEDSDLEYTQDRAHEVGSEVTMAESSGNRKGKEVASVINEDSEMHGTYLHPYFLIFQS